MVWQVFIYKLVPSIPIWQWGQGALFCHVIEEFKICGLLKLMHQEQQLQHYKRYLSRSVSFGQCLHKIIIFAMVFYFRVTHELTCKWVHHVSYDPSLDVDIRCMKQSTAV